MKIKWPKAHELLSDCNISTQYSDITFEDLQNNELIEEFYSKEGSYLSKEKYKNYPKENNKNEQPNPYLGNKTISVIPDFIELMLHKELDLISDTK